MQRERVIGPQTLEDTIMSPLNPQLSQLIEYQCRSSHAAIPPPRPGKRHHWTRLRAIQKRQHDKNMSKIMPPLPTKLLEHVKKSMVGGKSRKIRRRYAMLAKRIVEWRVDEADGVKRPKWLENKHKVFIDDRDTISVV